MTTIFHGCAACQVHRLLSGVSEIPGGLCVTDTADRAQLYADAQATREVCGTPRYAAGSAVVELETTEPVRWRRRPEGHGTLDVAEANIRTWRIVQVTVYTTTLNLKASVARIDGRDVKQYDYLHDRLGAALRIVLVDA